MEVQVGCLSKQKIVVSIRFPPKKMQIQVPNTWTINKLKCMIKTQIPVLDFDKFQLVHQGMVLKGSYPLKIYTPKGQNKLSLMIVKMQNQGSFEEYYSRRMNKFFRRVHHEQQDQFSLQQDSSEPLYTLPIYSQYYQDAYFKSKGLKYNRQQNNINNNDRNQRNQEGGAIVRIFNILQLVGLYFAVSMILNFGQLYHAGIIIAIVLAYYAIDYHVRNQAGLRRQRNNDNNDANGINAANIQNARNINQNNNQNINNRLQERQNAVPNQKNANFSSQKEQKKLNNNQSQQPQSKQERQQEQKIKPFQQNQPLKAKMLWCFCFLVEFLYCFVLSLFPNWTVQTHFEANRVIIRKMVNKIQQLDKSQKGKIKVD